MTDEKNNTGNSNTGYRNTGNSNTGLDLSVVKETNLLEVLIDGVPYVRKDPDHPELTLEQADAL